MRPSPLFPSPLFPLFPVYSRLFHITGVTDNGVGGIMDKLGIAQTDKKGNPTPTDAITQKLKKDCF